MRMSNKNDLAKFAKEIEKLSKEVIKDIIDDNYLKALGEKIVKEIQTRTRQGFGVADEGQPKEKLTPLEPSTKRRRNSLKKQGKLSNLTTPNKSNLTETGAMIDSISYKIEQGVLIFYFKGSDSNGVRNNEKAYNVSIGVGKDLKNPRPFFNLSDLQIKNITEQLEKKFRQEIRRRLNQTR